MSDRNEHVRELYEGLAFVSRQSRELGALLHPELPLVAHSLLLFLHAEPDSRAVDVATAFGLERSTVSRQLHQLEAAGLVRRAAERAGRRGQALELTDEGVRLLERAVTSSQTVLAEHLRAWSDADLERFALLLGRFVETSRAARLWGGSA